MGLFGWQCGSTTRYARFSNDLAQYDEFVDKNAIEATYWSDPTVKERKQAEFLVYHSFPWTGLIAIGAISEMIAKHVQHQLSNQEYCPQVLVKPAWYY